MNKKIILGLSLALGMATAGMVQAEPQSNNPIPGVTVERDGTVNSNKAQAKGWQDGHRMGSGSNHQRGPHGQDKKQGNRHHGAAAGLLTQAEAQTFRDQMMASKDYNACKRVQNQQHTTLLKRAKDKGVSFPTEPRKAGMCERMSDKGYFNRTK